MGGVCMHDSAIGFHVGAFWKGARLACNIISFVSFSCFSYYFSISVVVSLLLQALFEFLVLAVTAILVIVVAAIVTAMFG